MQELLWFAQPKAFDLLGALFRNENFGWQISNRCIPARKEPCASVEGEREQSPLRRQAVIVECVDPVGHIDVVADNPVAGLIHRAWKPRSG